MGTEPALIDNLTIGAETIPNKRQERYYVDELYDQDRNYYESVTTPIIYMIRKPNKLQIF
jgi:hypothetical protein